jgi:cell division protein FtsL
MSAELTFIIALAGLAASIITVLTFIIQGQTAKLKIAEEKGKLDQVIADMRNDLARAHEKIRNLDSGRQSMEGRLIALQKDMEHVVKTTDEIRTRLENHMDAGAPI